MANTRQSNIKLPCLTTAQAAIMRSTALYNIVCGGRDSGKSTIADDLVTAAAAQFVKSTVVYCLPDADAMAAARRRLYHYLRGHLSGTPTRDQLTLTNRSKILLIPVNDTGFNVMSDINMLVVDDAQKIEGFYPLWRDVIRPHVDRTSARAWVIGKPMGARDGIGRLFREHSDDASWAAMTLPTHARLAPLDGGGDEAEQRYAPSRAVVRAAIDKASEDLPEDAFAQEYLGAVLDSPIELSHSQALIGRSETFLQWCERLAEDGLKVDGLPFRLDDRPTMRWVYEQIPSTPEEAYGRKLVLMKCAQVGFTVMEMLAMIYLAVKFMPAKIGMYLPGQDLARIKSSQRFLPIVRTIPDAHRLLTLDPSGSKATGEGNVMIRNMGSSQFYFMWTSGRTSTESLPLDVLSFDEVQEMAVSDMEKTNERLSASRIRYTLMGSTANWPDRDIHFFYKKGSQHQFWTLCTSCDTHQILDDHFPNCIRLRDGDYRYVCHSCDAVIDDPQVGEWRAANPDGCNPDGSASSIHYPQFLSPTITPREIITAYFEADDMKNFFNRKRGKPYVDPSQVPVDLEMLNDCARIGMEMGVEWKRHGSRTFMGIDQMGAFNVALIAERLPSGHMAIIHAEEIYDEDPFARCDELMVQYGVSVCCVETLPNYNDAKRFSGRHSGKVFLAGYGNMEDDMMRWGDSVPNAAERKTSEEDRDRYTVRLDQYKCMQVAMKRIQQRVCVFPDPMGLTQEVIEKGLRHIVPVLKDRVFIHFTRTALIAEKDEEEKKFRRRVVKIGIDPHFSYAFMLLNVAWARSHGTTMFLTPDDTNGREGRAAAVEKQMPGLPSGVLDMLHLSGDVCGRCTSFDGGVCAERGFIVAATDPGCPVFVESEDA